MGLIGSFYIMTTFLGFGASYFVGQAAIKAVDKAVVAGLTLAASSAFAHDFYVNVIKRGKDDEVTQVRVAKRTGVIVG